MGAEDAALLGQERRAGPHLASQPCEACTIVWVRLVAFSQVASARLLQAERQLYFKSLSVKQAVRQPRRCPENDLFCLQAAEPELLSCTAARMQQDAGHADGG